MGSQWRVLDSSSTQVKDIAICNGNYIVLDFSHWRFSFLALQIIIRKYLIDRTHSIAVNVVPWDSVGVGCISIDDNKLVLILVIP